MPLRITATDAGFTFFNAIGEAVAPDVFIESRFNPDGALFQVGAASQWRSQTSFTNPNVTIDVRLAREAALPPGPRAGDATPLALAGLTFSRPGADGREVEIGTLDFETILLTEAVFHPNGAAAIGGGATPNWIAEIAAQMREAAEVDGYVFEGGAADDIFNPDAVSLHVNARGDLFGRGGDDVLTAQRGGGRIFGGEGDDKIDARGGAVGAWGGAGADTFDFSRLPEGQRAFGGRGRDEIIGGRGDDRLHGGASRDEIRGGDGDDRIDGGGAGDRLFGDNGDDELFGGQGNDLLKGGWGFDTLIGGLGDDKLRGGPMADVFLFAAGHGSDVITDFDPKVDRLEFAGASAADLSLVDDPRGVRVLAPTLEVEVLLLNLTEAPSLGDILL